MLKDMDTIINLAKSRGYIFAGSEIYGGLANSWDYGPLGILLKDNLENLWKKKFVQESKYNVEIDSSILMNPKVWEASGHLEGFSDPLIDCKSCKTRHRADKMIEAWGFKNGKDIIADGWSEKELKDFLYENNVVCPNCGALDYTDIRQFNLMYKTFQGVTEDKQSEIYLRPETAQGIFVNFNNILRSTRRKLPMGIAQVGKAFRNEITPGNFIFRTREFEQMELEFFCNPKEDEKWFKYWVDYSYKFLVDLGLNKDNLRLRNHTKEELSHYSKATTDIEYIYPFGWGELWGIANRQDFDLVQHNKYANTKLEYFDSDTNEKYIPYCIEPSLGLGRLLLAVLCDTYVEEDLEDEKRIVLKINPILAPYKVAVLPLSNKLSEKAEEIYINLSKEFSVDFDIAGSIGKRYRRQDEIGTPYCLTVDFETLEDNMVTIRDRDTMEQIRIKIEEVEEYIKERVKI